MRSQAEYTPLVEESSSRYRIVIPFSNIAWFTVAVPFFGFLFCIVWSIIYYFEHVNSTHCQVYNFFPSISAAIGHYSPQKVVWKVAIAIQAMNRAMVFVMYYRYYKETLYKWANRIGNVTLFTYALENISLVTLSFWTSNENYAFHKLSFITFLLMSFAHMVLACFVTRNCRNELKDFTEATSFKWKRRFLFLNVSSVISACYFFYRHNKYCEPLVYSMFALSEYAVVLSNMGFHVTAALDFAGRSLLISPNGFRII